MAGNFRLVSGSFFRGLLFSTSWPASFSGSFRFVSGSFFKRSFVFNHFSASFLASFRFVFWPFAFVFNHFSGSFFKKRIFCPTVLRCLGRRLQFCWQCHRQVTGQICGKFHRHSAITCRQPCAAMKSKEKATILGHFCQGISAPVRRRRTSGNERPKPAGAVHELALLRRAAGAQQPGPVPATGSLPIAPGKQKLLPAWFPGAESW